MFSSEGWSLTAITGAIERSRIARGSSRLALALTDQEGLDGRNIRIGGGLHPVAEFRWIKTGRGNALPAKQRCISVFHELTLINHYDHSSASESVWHFDDLWVRIARIGDNSLKLMAEINN